MNPKKPKTFKKTHSDRDRAKHKKKEEFTLYGWNACMSAFEKRPESLLRLFFSRSRATELKKVKNWCAEKKLPFRQLDQESLNKVASGTHHEGVVMVVKPLACESSHKLIRGSMPDKGLVVALDGIENPHNQGAILRSCAYFGVQGLIVPNAGTVTGITPSAARMAEGGWERVPVYNSSDLSSSLRDCRERGWSVVGADPAAKESINSVNFSFPMVLVLGNEQEGLSDRVKRRCDSLVHIPGAGEMQSLNVSVAAGILLADLDRLRNKKKK
ncbi:MAG: 23S rRNA (guanosine(2251)-2'-O)-methyltransferase RlmB [Nitrospinota bacterium]